MAIGISIKSFYANYFEKNDRLVCGLILFNLLFGLGCWLANTLTTQFPGNMYIPLSWVMLAPIFIGLALLAMRVRDISPRMAFLTKTYNLYFIIGLTEMVLMTGIQYTPFPTIDHQLVKIDALMGVHVPTLLNWVYSYPWLAKTLWFAYDSWVYQLMLIPILLGFFVEKRAIQILFPAVLIALSFGTIIYYFFPTGGPTLVFQSPHFIENQLATSLKFLQLHNYQEPTTYLGGMIAFPSYHAIAALLCVYATRSLKWLFYPLICLNTLLLAATVLLGWHYFIDVIASVTIVIVSIALTQWFNRKMV